MRSIKQVINSKPRNSKFFDYFVKQYGDSCTKGAGDDEILKNIRTFYTDLCMGNIQSHEKYLTYLRNDPRILQLALQDMYGKLISQHIIFISLEFARSSNHNIITLPQFKDTYEECKRRYNTYSVMYNGITNYVNTNQTQYLIQISVFLSNKMNRGKSGEICL